MRHSVERGDCCFESRRGCGKPIGLDKAVLTFGYCTRLMLQCVFSIKLFPGDG